MCAPNNQGSPGSLARPGPRQDCQATLLHAAHDKALRACRAERVLRGEHCEEPLCSPRCRGCHRQDVVVIFQEMRTPSCEAPRLEADLLFKTLEATEPHETIATTLERVRLCCFTDHFPTLYLIHMSLLGIYRASEASADMESLDEGLLVAGVGLDGDRYARHVGTYSVLRISQSHPGEREPGRQLTLLSADSVRERMKEAKLLSQLPTSLLGNLRRNLVVTGISAEQLLHSVGRIVQIGNTCQVLIHRHCVPCLYNERKNGIPGLMEAIWKESGVSCEVLIGGPIRVSDAVVLQMDEIGHRPIDPGHQPPGFYLPPSQRTVAMVKDALQEKRLTMVKLETIDSEGVARLDRAYGSVGLTFWPPKTTTTTTSDLLL